MLATSDEANDVVADVIDARSCGKNAYAATTNLCLFRHSSAYPLPWENNGHPYLDTNTSHLANPNTVLPF